MLGMISSKASPSPNSMVSLVLWEEAAISVLSIWNDFGVSMLVRPIKPNLPTFKMGTSPSLILKNLASLSQPRKSPSGFRRKLHVIYSMPVTEMSLSALSAPWVLPPDFSPSKATMPSTMPYNTWKSNSVTTKVTPFISATTILTKRAKHYIIATLPLPRRKFMASPVPFILYSLKELYLQ